MKTFDVRMTELAQQDLEACAAFLRERSARTAEQWLETLIESMLALSQMPRVAQRAPHSDDLGFELRRQVVGDTLVYFAIDEDAGRVDIMRIWPARRRPLEAKDFAFDEEPTLVDDEEP